MKKNIFLLILFYTSFSFSKNYYQKFEEALQFYEEGRFKLSEDNFKNILEVDRDFKDPASQFFVAKSQSRQGLWSEARRTCKTLLANYKNSPYEVDVYMLLGDCAFNEGKITLAFQNYLTARKSLSDIAYKNEIDQRIYNCIGLGLSEDKIESMLFRERNNFNRAIINLARCYNSWIEGNHFDMKSMIKEIDTYFLPGKFSNIFGNLKTSVNKISPKPTSFGVIIPLSGINKKLGENYFLGLSESFKSSNIRFIVYDSEGLGTNSLRITTNIQKNNLISGIIGPLTSEEVFALAGLNLQVPVLIPKISPDGLPALNKNLFFLSPSMKTLAKKTAQLIINELGLSSIAVLSPGYGLNKLKTDYFINECKQLGIDPVSIEWYVETPLDLSRQLGSIRQKAWELIPKEDDLGDIKNLEIDSLDALFDVDVQDFFSLPNENEEKMNKRDSSKIELETIQAIYIPIGPGELTYVGTQLPFYNLKTTIFGNENWLNMQLLNQKVIGPHVQGMHVVSDISSAIINEEDFLNNNYYNLAKEHMKFFEEVLGDNFYNRKQFSQQLKRQKYFGEKSTIDFSGPSQNENMSVQILKYKDQKIKVIGVFQGDHFQSMDN